MGLFDTIGGMMSGAAGGDAAAAGPIGAMGGLLQSHEGGLPGMVGAFEKAGMGGMIGSWISNEANQMITPEQVTKVLGNGPVGQFAAKLGITPDMAAQHISELLPQLVNHLTPNGAVPPGGGTDALSGLLNSFKH